MVGRNRSTFKLDHSYNDPKPGQLDKPFTITEERPDPDDGDYAKLLETPKDRRRRYRSLGIMNLTAFTFNIAFAIVLTSAYPYLKQMEDGQDVSKGFLGLVIAAQPFAQLFSSPLMGYLGNRFGSVRWLTMFTMGLLCGGFVFYACIHSLPPPRKWYLVIARFIIGAAAGTFTLCFSYIATATTLKERTTAFSLLSLSSASAFVVGPGIQAAFSPLGDETIYIGSNLYFNAYTGPAWISAALALINMMLFVPGIFTEYNIAKKEGEYLATRAQKKADQCDGIVPQQKKPDKLGLVAVIIISASIQFNFIFLETLATPITTDQLGWTGKQAIFIVGLAFAGAGIYSGFLYAGMGFLARKLGERNLLAVGITLLAVGPLCMLPFGSQLPPLRYNNGTETTLGPTTTVPTTKEFMGNLIHFNDNEVYKIQDNHKATLELLVNVQPLSGDESDNLGGCPVDEQPWCAYLPAITGLQFILGFFFICSGYPFGNSVCNAIFSKMLGPHPQGTWMGLLSAGGCLARVLCPLFVSNIYATYGTWATFGFMIGLMVCILAVVFIAYRRLIPFQYEEVKEPNKY